jgi:class 3 adenylate cyclase
LGFAARGRYPGKTRAQECQARAVTTATRTVLFTDLPDYTAQVSRTDREGLRRLLGQHEAVVGPLVARNRGRVLKNIGDSFLCLFPAATDALRAALEILGAGSQADVPTIRLAMTTGDVEEIEDDVFGSTVNLAARILGVTPANECWFGQGTRICMNEAEVAWEEVGQFHLKGIPGDEPCYRLVPAGRVWLPLPLASAARNGRLVRLRPGERPESVAANAVVLFEGFTAGSPALEEALAGLPVLEPSAFYLAAHTLSAGDRHAWTRSGRGLVIGTPEAIGRALVETEGDARGAKPFLDDSSTMFLELRRRVDLQLVVCGLALPAVPLAEVVAGYSFDLLEDGSWVTQSQQAVLRVDVHPGEVAVRALSAGVSVDGRLLAPGEEVALRDGAALVGPGGALRYRQTDGAYAGVLLADTDQWLGLLSGQTAELGRKPNPPGLAFPNRDRADNLRWCSGPRAARAQASQFTLDRYLSGRRQAAVQLSGNAIRLVPLHRECPTYVLRRDGLQAVEEPTQVTLGDLIVAGTNVIGLRAPE